MSRPKILLVDDSGTVLLMEQMILKGAFDIVVARDGQEAVDKAATERPDIIVMDVIMPKMTGLEACRRLRADQATSSIPIILVTTKGEGTDFEAGFRSGCTDYLTKPIDALEFMAKIRGHLGV
jgi:CheY-like chemotaxis protein